MKLYDGGIIVFSMICICVTAIHIHIINYNPKQGIIYSEWLEKYDVKNHDYNYNHFRVYMDGKNPIRFKDLSENKRDEIIKKYNLNENPDLNNSWIWPDDPRYKLVPKYSLTTRRGNIFLQLNI